MTAQPETPGSPAATPDSLPLIESLPPPAAPAPKPFPPPLIKTAPAERNAGDVRWIRLWAWTIGAAIVAITAWRIAALHLTPMPLFFDEAQYWDWSRRLSFGYFSKPPLLAWLIAAATGIFGHAEAAIRMASPVMHAVAAAFIGMAGYRLGGASPSGARLGGLAALVYISLPGVAVSSGIISTDAPLLACWAMALFGFWRAIETNQRQWWLLTGAAIGLGMMAKYIMALFALSAVLYLMLTPARRTSSGLAGPAAAIGIALLIVAPNIAWNVFNGFVTFSHTAANANLGGTLFNPAKMAEFVGAQFGVFGPITFAILVGLLVTARRWWRDERARFLIVFAAPPLLIMIAQSFISRAHANWAAPTYVAASLLVVAWADQARRWIVPAAIAIHLALQVPIAHFDVVVRAFGHDLSAKRDPFRRNRGWDDIGRQIAAHLAERPGSVLLADDRMPLVEMLYYANAPRVVKWNPNGLRRDHYDMSTSMRDLAGRDVLLMTKTPDATPVRPYFDSATPRGTVWTVTHPDGYVEYEIYWLKGYRGTAPSPQAAPLAQ
ncbi:MAG: glycosyltransferase family 39 protein [Alphaproteobacteria bacterium]